MFNVASLNLAQHAVCMMNMQMSCIEFASSMLHQIEWSSCTIVHIMDDHMFFLQEDRAQISDLVAPGYKSTFILLVIIWWVSPMLPHLASLCPALLALNAPPILLLPVYRYIYTLYTLKNKPIHLYSKNTFLYVPIFDLRLLFREASKRKHR